MHKQILKGRLKLMQSYPFFACIALGMKTVPSYHTENMSTDGRSIYYNPDFMDNATASQSYCMQAKAVLHKSLSHHLRRGDRHEQLWNAACTMAVAPILIKNGLTDLPEEMLFTAPEFEGKNAEQIYDILMELMPPQQEGQEGQEGEEGEDGEGSEAGDQDMEGQGQGQGQGQGEGQGEGEGSGESQEDQPEPESGDEQEHDERSSRDKTEEESDNPQPWPKGIPRELQNPTVGVEDAKQSTGQQMSDEDRQQEEQRVKQEVMAAKQASEHTDRKAGSGSKDMLREIINDTNEVNINWDAALRELLSESLFVEELDYSRRNRRLNGTNEVIMPGKTIERTGTIVCAVDTSGSLSGEELGVIGNHIKEIIGVIQPTKTYVIFCDDRIKKVIEFHPGDEIILNMYGGGGTDFNPPFAYIEKHNIQPDAFIYFTDGEGSVDMSKEPDCPVIWASTIYAPYFRYDYGDGRYEETPEDMPIEEAVGKDFGFGQFLQISYEE